MSIENVRKWFMIHTYSGYEKKVKTDLEQKVGTLQLRDVVTNILVPEEETTEIVRGKPKKIYRKLFPAYVIGMDTSKETIKLDFAEGDFVKILKGSFIDQEGQVAEIDYEHGRVKVMVDIFGRMTPVEIEVDGVLKV